MCTDAIFLCILAALPKAFQAAIHGLIKAVSYTDGIRSTMRVGGCNASRGAFIGACFGAMVSNYITLSPLHYLSILASVVGCISALVPI